MAGPMLGMISPGRAAWPSARSSAHGLAQLAEEVLTSTEVGLPLGPEGTAALLPAAIATFTEGLDRPAGEVLVFLAAREAAHHRLFGHVPWLRQRLLATVEEFARGITIDTSRIEELARDIDPIEPGGPAAGHELGDVRAADHRVAEGGAAPPRDAARARRGLGGRRSSPTPWASACPARPRCARRCAAAAPPAGRPSRPSPPSSGWSCGRAGCATPPSCGGGSARSAASRAATRVWAHPDLHADRRRPRRPGRASSAAPTTVAGAGAAAGSAESFTDLDDPLARLEAGDEGRAGGRRTPEGPDDGPGGRRRSVGLGLSPRRGPSPGSPSVSVIGSPAAAESPSR